MEAIDREKKIETLALGARQGRRGRIVLIFFLVYDSNTMRSFVTCAHPIWESDTRIYINSHASEFTQVALSSIRDKTSSQCS